MKKLFFVSLGILLLALAFLSGTEAVARRYSTNFPLTENPISEGGNWINGGAVGLDWYNIRTDGAYAHGTNTTGSYTDPTAILTGTWGANQTVEATIYSVNQTSSLYQEVELRLRSSISAHSCRGYEVSFRCLATGNSYIRIVRWNGALGDFTYLNGVQGPGISNGDVIKATVVGVVITAYVNGVEVVQATDNTYSSANPGMGFNYGCNGTYGDFGLTRFTASDDAEELTPLKNLGPPKNLRILPR
jgi:hypothetical protein